MTDKAQTIKEFLEGKFPKIEIEYREEDGFHIFRFFGNPNHWLYIPDTYLDDREALDIIERFVNFGIVDIYREATENKWLYLGSEGVKEVDENFTKPVIH